MHAGQRIRDYVLSQKIGEGGMGEVWSATHEILHRQVAIKAMAPDLARAPELEARFLDEARAQANLQHARILGVTEFFREKGVYYLIMPLVKGCPLDERIAEARGPLPLAEAAYIASDLLDALDYAHQQRIIHRDVKPSNILLDQSGHAYLMDFGIALLIGNDRRTRTGASLGTPYYTSPEQIRTPKKIDHRTDVYSAACVIYEMLAGRPPFVANEEDEGNTDYVIQEAHVHRQPEPLRRWNPALPPALDAAVLRGLAKQPDQRYSGCGEFRRALEAVVAGLPATRRTVQPEAEAVPPPAAEPSSIRQTPRNSPRLIPAAVILCLVCLLALGFWLTRSGAKSSPIDQAEVEALVASWQAAQNRSDFAAYRDLYATQMTGVKRVGADVREFNNRMGWLDDRARMFQQPMKVDVDNVRMIRTMEQSAVVRFEQTFAQGGFRDSGTKELVVVREDEEGGLRISREEMVESTVLSRPR